MNQTDFKEKLLQFLLDNISDKPILINSILSEFIPISSYPFVKQFLIDLRNDGFINTHSNIEDLGMQLLVMKEMINTLDKFKIYARITPKGVDELDRYYTL